MKTRVLVVLLVLALMAVSGLGMASAQEGTRLKALPRGTVQLYTEPNANADFVKVITQQKLYVEATDVSGEWLQVSFGDKSGWVMASNVTVLNLPLLAPKYYVDTRRAGQVALFAKPDLASRYLMAVPEGTVGTVLAVSGMFAYVETPLGTGWSVTTGWKPMPEGAMQGYVSLTRGGNVLGVFKEALAGSDLVGTIPQNGVVWWMGAPEGEWAPVMLEDGTRGYAIARDFTALPMTQVEAEVAGRSQPALFSKPDFSGDLLGVLEPGTVLTFIEAVDDFWYKLYHPAYGFAYGMSDNFGNPYFVATVQQPNSIVRQGPNDNLYLPVAVLPAGTDVIVKGVNESRTWIEVALPLEAVTYGYRGVDGWMRDFLFVDNLGNNTLDTTLLAVTE